MFNMEVLAECIISHHRAVAVTDFDDEAIEPQSCRIDWFKARKVRITIMKVKNDLINCSYLQRLYTVKILFVQMRNIWKK